MTDNTAPERIWATRIGVQPNNGHAGIFRSDAKEGQEYIRADLLERAIQTALDMATRFVDCDCGQEQKIAVLSVPPNSGARWRVCSNTKCGAIDAADIFAISVEDVVKNMEGE